MNASVAPEHSSRLMLRKEILDDRDKLMKSLQPFDPPSWPTPKGSDPLLVLDVERGNRLLKQGHDAGAVALLLASLKAARSTSHARVVEAVGDLMGPRRC